MKMEAVFAERYPMPDPMENKRLVSLDAFRGLVIAAMIVVNSPGTYRAIYPQLKHGEWNQCTFADLVFPFFLFMVGVSSAFSIARRKSKGETNARIELFFLRRFFILFGIGLFVGSYPVFHLATLRIPGVLQRIAACYLAASLIVMRTGTRGQALWAAGLLLSYWWMLEFVPVPGIGAGVLEPGRNFPAWFDSLVLNGHMWDHYRTWDPEGIASTIPAVSTTLLGALTGRWLHSGRTGKEKACRLFGAGLTLIVLGLVFSIRLPINKGIWTSSYAVLTAGLAAACLAVLFRIIDVKKHARWSRPFVIFGMNAVTIYVLSELLDQTLRFIRCTDAAGVDRSLRSILFRRCFEPFMDLKNASLSFAVVYTLLMFLAAWFLWRKRWFVKV